VRDQLDTRLLRTSLEPNDSGEILRLTTGPVALVSGLQKRLLSQISGSTSEALGTWESRGSP
jgi:hypothetical protein